jgi:hypothetical protein
MTASDKKKLTVLIGLVVLAGGVWFWLYRPVSSSSSGSAATKAASKAKDAKVAQEAQIRLDLLQDVGADDVGRKNLFQYRQKVLPQAQQQTRQQTVTQVPTPYVPPPPVTNPTPQFKVFRYEGFSGPTKNGKLLASLTEGGNTYYAREGDCIMGQYCVRRVTESTVEIEDTVLNRRQTFQRVQPQ